MQSGVEQQLRIPRKLWTRTEAHRLVESGLPNADRLELINGELIDRRGKKHPHVLWQTLIQQWLQMTFGPEQVRSEAPIDVAFEENERNEPEPDLTVTKRSIREYNSNPSPDYLLLVVEVSDSSLLFDLRVKSAIYARARIAEYWVMDLASKTLIVHRDPANGTYSSINQYRSNEEVAPLAAPYAYMCLDRI